MNCWQGKLGVFGELKTLTFDLSTGKTPFHTITKMSVLSIPKVPNSSDSLSALTGELLHDLHWGWYRSLDSRLPPVAGHCQHRAPGSGQCCCLQRRICWSCYILREGAYDCLLATSIFTQNLLTTKKGISISVHVTSCLRLKLGCLSANICTDQG